MAIYRQVYTKFWQDTDMQDLTPEQKYFYLYLMTNDKTTPCGIYEITLRNIAFETGYNEDTIKKLIDIFIDLNKILYSKETDEIMLLNWFKYNSSSSPKYKKAIITSLENVKNFSFIEQYILIANTKEEYLDTVSIQYLYGIHSKSKRKSKSNSIHICVCDENLPVDSVDNVDNLKSDSNITSAKKSEYSEGADNQDCKNKTAEKSTKVEGADLDNCKGNEEYSKEFEAFWKAYPRKKVKRKAYRAWSKLLKTGVKPEVIIKAAKNYSRYCEDMRLEERFIKHASTFIGRDEPFRDYINFRPRGKPKINARGEVQLVNQHEYDWDYIEKRIEEKMFDDDSYD